MNTGTLSATPSSGIDNFERGLKLAGKTVSSGVDKVKAASGGRIQAFEDAVGDVGQAVEDTFAAVLEVPNRVWPEALAVGAVDVKHKAVAAEASTCAK